MSSNYTELRSQSTQVDAGATASLPSDLNNEYAGRTFFDTTLHRLYIYDGSGWVYVSGMTTTSTSTTSTSTTSTSTSSTSTTSSSTSTTSTSTSTTSSSTSTTVY